MALARVGIIGGAGPMAGALLFQKIISLAQEKYHCKEDADFPFIMLLNYPFTNMLDTTDESIRRVLKNELDSCFKIFKNNKIDIAAIACNTLHEFLEEDREKTFPLHMIQETADKLEDGSKTLVLCTNTSAKCGLHKRYFDCLYPEKDLQQIVQQLIETVLGGHLKQEDAYNLAAQLNNVLPQLRRHSNQKVGLVLGCTEFSVFNAQFPLHAHGLSTEYVVFDPNTIIAEKICALVFKNKK